MITLANEMLRLQLVPDAGGSIARCDALDGDDAQPVLAPALTLAGGGDGVRVACYPLLPWANRIDANGFDFDGRHWTPPPTTADEPSPLHGLAAWRRWDCLLARADEALLTLRVTGTPWDFRAWQHFRLTANRLSIRLIVFNFGRRMPYGIGWHPCWPRDPQTRLQAPATAVWTTSANRLPVARIAPAALHDFSTAQRLPADRALDHNYCGWNGRATITSGGLRTDVVANVEHFQLYAPVGADYFCFEPVDHPPNAVNLPGGAAANAMTVLDSGGMLVRDFALTVSREGA